MKNQIFFGGGGGQRVTKKNIYGRGGCLKEGLGQFADLRGGLVKKGVTFLRGGVGTPILQGTMTIYIK